MREISNISLADAVTMHVRRGDYLELNHIYNILGVEYFLQALSILRDPISWVIIVTNDKEWCKEHLEPRISHSVVYSPFDDPLHDFVLLHLGRRMILSNSSFSWWAAYLKIVYGETSYSVTAPRYYYNTSGPLAYLNRDSYYPETWNLLNNI